MTHRGYISSNQHAFLAGMSLVDKTLGEQTGIDVIIPLNRMLYISAFQNGIDTFLIPILKEEQEKGIDFINTRKLHLDPSEDWKLSYEISSIFQSFKRPIDKDSYDRTNIESFISSLFCAMHHNAAMINLMPIPTPEDIRESFVPELAFPLIDLISQLKPFNESLPIPMTTIDHSNVNRFQEILESSLYAEYSQAHTKLELIDTKTQKVLNDIHIRSKNLIKDAGRLLAPRPSLIHIFNIIPKVIDTIFGKLPGTLAQLASNLAQDRLKQNKQIVIYNFGQWAIDFVLMRHSLNNKTS